MVKQLISGALRNASQLGKPIPDSPHAVSVALPLWRHVVAYEEKDPVTIGSLETGYPRFVIHPLVAEAAKRFGRTGVTLPIPSPAMARRCSAYIQQRSGQPAEILENNGLSAVRTTTQGGPALREFWQHTGVVLSSRRADAWLAGRGISSGHEPLVALRAKLASFYDCRPGDVFLTPSGMAAQYEALRAVLARLPRRRTVQLGFPYVDTFKLQQRFGHGAVMLHHLPTMDTELREVVAREPLAGAFCEIPGNPLLGSADLSRIGPLLREKRIPLVIDDVVATPFNIDVGPHADLIATSLTKFVSGRGDVMAGALICNPRSPLHAELLEIIRSFHEEMLWWEDAALVEELAGDFPDRMRRHNDHGLLIAERLKNHPTVEKVWYPKWEFAEEYERVRKPGAGWGALITFLPKQAESFSERIYDSMHICKGPSLGTYFTLACPFTLLAHYTELDWAEDKGVPRNLIRISVGLEDPEDTWARLSHALETARSQKQKRDSS